MIIGAVRSSGTLELSQPMRRRHNSDDPNMTTADCCILQFSKSVTEHRTIILPVVLYGRENWSLTLREECRLRVFENRVLRRLFRPKRDEVTGEWSKLHNEELNDLYFSPNIVRLIKSRS